MGSIGSEELGEASHSVPMQVKLRIQQVYGVFAHYVQNVDCNLVCMFLVLLDSLHECLLQY